jgi:hypothetical protein
LLASLPWCRYPDVQGVQRLMLALNWRQEVVVVKEAVREEGVMLLLLLLLL